MIRESPRLQLFCSFGLDFAKFNTMNIIIEMCDKPDAVTGCVSVHVQLSIGGSWSSGNVASFPN